MLSEEKLKQLPPKAQAYWRKAQEFIAKNQADWYAIKPNTPEWREWTAFFERQGWKPFGIRKVEQGTCDTFLVPAQWPEWFETLPAPTDLGTRRKMASPVS